jgi:uncharacterized MAPEG superfamily protein
MPVKGTASNFGKDGMESLHGNYTIPYICILIAWFAPNVLAAASRIGAPYDNRQPRASSDAATGWRRRAYWAHTNAIENFAPFAIAVAIARIEGVPAYKVSNLAMAFVLCRVAYSVFYITNKSTLRSIAYVLGYACAVGILALAF